MIKTVGTSLKSHHLLRKISLQIREIILVLVSEIDYNFKFNKIRNILNFTFPPLPH